MEHTSYAKLTVPQQELVDAASEALNAAYNPYSHFSVGAALRSIDGKVITASNVENAAYGSSICAERSAIVRANAQGKRRFSALAVIGRGKEPTKEATAPCGACRQMLYEAAQLSGGDFEVILSTTNKDKIVITTMKELLPLAFGPADLGIDIKKYR
jgi:cytidine deaminase